jgi:hypothetical protein
MVLLVVSNHLPEELRINSEHVTSLHLTAPNSERKQCKERQLQLEKWQSYRKWRPFSSAHAYCAFRRRHVSSSGLALRHPSTSSFSDPHTAPSKFIIVHYYRAELYPGKWVFKGLRREGASSYCSQCFLINCLQQTTSFYPCDNCGRSLLTRPLTISVHIHKEYNASNKNTITIILKPRPRYNAVPAS